MIRYDNGEGSHGNAAVMRITATTMGFKVGGNTAGDKALNPNSNKVTNNMTAIVKFKPTCRVADWALWHSQSQPY